MLLDGTPLQGETLERLKSMVARSFIPEQLRARTPPPSESLAGDLSSAWNITSDDLRPSSPVSIDKGKYK